MRRGAAWTFAAAGTTCWGVLAAVGELPWQSLVAVFLAAGMLAASLTLSTEAVSSDRIHTLRAARVGALTGLVVVVTIGLASSVGAAGVAVLSLVLLTRPGLLLRVRGVMARRREQTGADADQERPDDRSGSSSATPPSRDGHGKGSFSSRAEADRRSAAPLAAPSLDTAPDWSPTLTVPSHLSVEDLCLAWESSGRALNRCTTVGARLRAVRVRQACLDELERRHPDGVRAWVLAGADPESSPARYLTG